MPALQRLLTRGERQPLAVDYSTILCSHFELSQDASSDLPVAALSALGDGLDPSTGWWLRVDPVHMVADRDQLYLSASTTLVLEQAEADAFVAELNRLYADDGWRFFAVTSQRWYLRLPEALSMRSTPTLKAIGSRVGDVLPQGEDALYWQRVMTEIQMLLHSSTVNTRRAEAGLMEVNSLWFWGGGELPDAEHTPRWQRMLAQEPLARGLSLSHGIITDTSTAAALESLRSGEGAFLWQVTARSLQDFEAGLVAPLLNCLKSAELDELVIELPGILRCRVERAHLRRWWRRDRSLVSLLNGRG